MELFFKELGTTGPTVMVLHGLYGSSDNWVTIGRQLSQDFRVILVDQRNHGASGHSPEHNYTVLANDLLDLMDELGIETTHLIGHSMGGKTAMAFALQHPDRTDKLVVMDIAPKPYASENKDGANNHALILEALDLLPITKCQSREEIDQQLSKSLTDKNIRQFLLKNVTRNEQQQFAWKLNIGALRTNLDEILDGFSNSGLLNLSYLKPAVFIRGENSGYIHNDDISGIKRLFPQAEVVTIPSAGHWLHAEQPDLVLKTIRYFLVD